MKKIEFDLIKMKDISIKFKEIDDFCELYGWGVYKHGLRSQFILYDLQCGEIIDFFQDFYALITRICGRALDYYSNEYEWEDNEMHISDFNYMSKLITLYNMYNVNTKDDEWLNAKMEWLRKDIFVYGEEVE